jgi:hypothetical protein
MKSIRNSMDPKVKENMKKNTKIPRKKKKNKNNQSLHQESQDYQPDMNSLKEIKQKNRKL